MEFTARDLEAAQQVVSTIADRLEQTATQYDNAEDLNISGFGGSAQDSVGIGDTYGNSLAETFGFPAAIAGLSASLAKALDCLHPSRTRFAKRARSDVMGLPTVVSRSSGVRGGSGGQPTCSAPR